MSAIEATIRKVLPGLDNDAVTKVMSLLSNELGVEEVDDLQHVEESDVLTVLKPVLARKLLKAWKQKANTETGHNFMSDSECTESASLEDNSSSFSSSGGFRECGDGWDFNFAIPWSSFPKSLLLDCEKGKRPDKQARLQMVRVIVDSVHKMRKKPKLKDMERIAYRIVSKYPESFKDEIEGFVIGTGVESLTTQLMYRSDNCNRKNVKKLSCLDNDQPSTSTVDNNEEKVDYLKTVYLLTDRDDHKVQQLMNQTFSEQRQDIENKLLIYELKNKWPFLFEEKYLFNHYETLLNVENFKQNFIANLKDGTETVFK